MIPKTIDIEERSQTSYTTQCNSVVNPGAQTTKQNKTKTKTNAKQMHPWSSRMHVYLHTSTAVDAGDIPKDPQFEPHARIKMALVLGSPLYICAKKSHFTQNVPCFVGVHHIYVRSYHQKDGNVGWVQYRATSLWSGKNATKTLG